MKKAKLLLTVVILLTVIGAALSYKVRNQDNVFYMNTTVSGQKLCTVATVLRGIVTDFGGQATLLSTVATYTACPTIQTTNLF